MTDDAYSLRQRTMDAAYSRQYQEWVRSLPPEEREALAAQGLDCPDASRRSGANCGLDRDFADTSLASERPDISSQIDEAPTAAAGDLPESFLSERVWDALRRMIGEVMALPNRSLTVECLAVVSGLSYVGDSMCDIARRHGVSRAAVSKRCVEMTEKLGLLPSRAMRSLTARRAYRDAQLRFRKSAEQ
jgi:hypothetical protein